MCVTLVTEQVRVFLEGVSLFNAAGLLGKREVKQGMNGRNYRANGIQDPGFMYHKGGKSGLQFTIYVSYSINFLPR